MKTNNPTGRFAWRFGAAFAAVLTWATSAAAQTVVVGTGNPEVDVPGVQAAVDQITRSSSTASITSRQRLLTCLWARAS